MRQAPRPVLTVLAAALVAAAVVPGGVAAAAPAAAPHAAPQTVVAQAPQATAIRLDPGYRHPAFEGWGTALTWFANVTGGWPEQKRAELADALYGADGLGFTIARYNIGGGDSPETEPYMRPGAAVPGYWNRPADVPVPEPADWWDPADPDHWNWTADANQQWWVAAAQQRGADTVEAFSNSAPYFMTESGLVSGNTDPNRDNLRADQYDRFAAYLAGAVEHLERTGIDVDSVSPVNEPNTGYWRAGGRQEGSHWDPASQQRAIIATAAALAERGIDAPVAAMDETNPGTFLRNWEQYAPAAKAAIGRLNVHTYGTGQRAGVRDVAKGERIPLWMSEVDLGPGGIPQDFTDIRPGLALSELITDDITELEPRAWVLWQAVEDHRNMRPGAENMNWGLIQVDLQSPDPAAEPVRRNKKYWAMGNYSRFIRPGDQVIRTDQADTLAAVGAGGSTAAVVHTNTSTAPRTVTIDLSGFATVAPGATAVPHTTSAGQDLERGAPVPVQGRTITATVPAQSVTTFVVDGVGGVDPAAVPVPDGAERTIVGTQSGRALTLAGESLVQSTVVAGDPRQRWVLDKVTDGSTSTERYEVVHAATGRALTDDGGTLRVTARGGGDAQRWMLSGTGNGRHTFVNVASGRLVDVGGQSTAEAAPVGTWRPTAGPNQSWSLVG